MLPPPRNSSCRPQAAGHTQAAHDGQLATVTLRQAAGEDAYSTLSQAAARSSNSRGAQPATAGQQMGLVAPLRGSLPAPGAQPGQADATGQRQADNVAMAQTLADELMALQQSDPDTNLVGVVLSDVRRQLHRNCLTAVPAAMGFVIGFLVAQGLMVEAGFNRIFPIPARPFNPHADDHRGQGAALIGWALAGGITSSILLSSLGQAAGGALQARLQPGRRLPASPVADLLLADAGALVGRHKRHVLPTFVLGLIGFIVPQCLATQAGFNFLNSIEARPFNPGGVTNRTLASALLGWSLAMSVLGGLPLGILGGVLIGASIERLLGPKT